MTYMPLYYKGKMENFNMLVERLIIKYGGNSPLPLKALKGEFFNIVKQGETIEKYKNGKLETVALRELNSKNMTISTKRL